jgi:hypothetical protein
VSGNHERLAERYPTRWQPGEVIQDDAGALYEILEVPLAVIVQKMVLGRAGRPLAGLREKPFLARAEQNAVQVGRGRWARRVPVEAA